MLKKIWKKIFNTQKTFELRPCSFQRANIKTTKDCAKNKYNCAKYSQAIEVRCNGEFVGYIPTGKEITFSKSTFTWVN